MKATHSHMGDTSGSTTWHTTMVDRPHSRTHGHERLWVDMPLQELDTGRWSWCNHWVAHAQSNMTHTGRACTREDVGKCPHRLVGASEQARTEAQGNAHETTLL